MNVFDYVKLKDKLESLRKTQNEKTQLSIHIKHSQAKIKLINTNLLKEQISIGNQFDLTPEEVLIMIEEKDNKQYMLLGEKVCQTWSQFYSKNSVKVRIFLLF